MVRAQLFLASLLTIFLLAACSSGGGGGGAVSNMTGEWVATYTQSGQSFDYILEIDDSGGNLEGDIYTEFAGFRNYSGSFTGTRSGSTVVLRVGALSATGTLSGRQLRFGDASALGADDLVFTKQ